MMHGMDHFRIITAICRIGLPIGGEPLRFQVERLSKALRDGGEVDQAATLDKLLAAQAAPQTLKPSRLVQSSLVLAGEEITAKTPVPVDKESASPLCEIHFPDRADAPIMPANLAEAVARMIEEWNHADELAAMGAAPPRTCLLFGQPGTGKTRLAYAIGNALNLPVVLARLDGLISSFLGTTARNIGTLFEFANRYRCVLLLDEFDAVAKLRDDPQEVGEIKRVVNTLLQNIDKRRETGYTIAITNHEGLLDSAIWRRFEIRLHIPLPELEERKNIIRFYSDPLPLSAIELQLLGWFSDGFSGSDLEGMVRSLKRFAAVHSREKFVLHDALRAYAVSNASGEADTRMQIVLKTPPEIARSVMSSSEVGLSQQDVGKFLEKDQATISRWIKSDQASERVQ